MLKDIKDSPLYAIANPNSIAFFGASNNVGNMGVNLLLSVQALGFPGPIYPVHSKEKTVQGFEAFTHVRELPEIPDLAVLVLPTRLVNLTLEDCGEKGIKRAIVVSGGFKEVGGQGVALEEEMKAICRRYGLRVMGPNCLGVTNPHRQLNTTIIPHEGSPGFIGLASQSGSFVTQMFNYLSRMRLGFSTAFSVGNEADIDLVDALEYLGACPHTKVIALYVEGIKRGRDFVRIARSIAPHKPIVAYYAGGSETGRKAGFSHTGALAGPDPLYDGIFRQSGVVRARSVTELFDFCWTLGALPEPAGNRVVIQTHSGGPGAAAADACGRSGLRLPDLSPETIEKMTPFVPHTGSLNNPVDLTFSKNPLDFFSAIPQTLLEDANIDILLIYFLTPESIMRRALTGMGLSPEQLDEETPKLIKSLAQGIVDLRKISPKPIVGYTWRSLEEPFSIELLEEGLPLFPEPERAARALAAMVRYSAYKRKIKAGGETAEAKRD